MRERFVNAFITELSGIVPVELLPDIRDELFIFVNDYDIAERETSVVPYTGYMPECYKIYMTTMKIEGAKDNTLRLYNMALKDFFYTVNKKMSEITTNDIRVYLYITKKNRNICNRTLDSRRAILHSFFEWCANEGYVSANPCRNIRPIKYTRKEREPLSGMELEKVRNACRTIREKALVEFLYSTGARVREVERVKLSDIDFVKGEVTLFGKGDKYRRSYLSERCKFYLNEYLKTRSDECMSVFLTERRPYTGLQKAGIERVIRDIGKRSGIGRHLYPHLFRHSMATDLLRRDVPVTDVQKILGHVNINTTMVYAKTLNENVKAGHKRSII